MNKWSNIGLEAKQIGIIFFYGKKKMENLSKTN